MGHLLLLSDFSLSKSIAYPNKQYRPNTARHHEYNSFYKNILEKDTNLVLVLVDGLSKEPRAVGMRNNQPVTQREISLAPQQKLISTTDVRGVITYCNDAFVEVSGFDKADLIGAPQNIVRHPDVPLPYLPTCGVRSSKAARGWVSSKIAPEMAITTGSTHTSLQYLKAAR